MKKFTAILLIICSLLVFSSCTAKTEEHSGDDFTVTDTAVIEVEGMGNITLELYGKLAPATVDNFRKLCQQDFYKGIIFHRVIENFMIQAGDPTGTGMSGSGETIKGEFNENGFTNNLSHSRGVISMARAKLPDSASSQFFICHKDAKSLDGKYAAFGRVTDGMDIVDKIASTDTDSNDKPLNDIVIKTITISEVK